jgi:hypothetical protein
MSCYRWSNFDGSPIESLQTGVDRICPSNLCRKSTALLLDVQSPPLPKLPTQVVLDIGSLTSPASDVALIEAMMVACMKQVDAGETCLATALIHFDFKQSQKTAS